MKPKYMNRAAKELLQHEELMNRRQEMLNLQQLEKLDLDAGEEAQSYRSQDNQRAEFIKKLLEE